MRSKNYNAYMRNYNKTHPKVYIDRKIRSNAIPWIKYYRSAKQRCNDKNHVKYNRYGGRGIKFLLTIEEVKELWFRDKAYNLKKPSIDRKNINGDYTFENCRFIEHSLNSVNKSSTRKFKDSNNIIYESITSLSKYLKISRKTFYLYLNNKITNIKGLKFYEV